MRRHRFHRLTASLVAAFMLLALGGEALAVHACPMHDGALAVASGSGDAGQPHHAADAAHDDKQEPEPRQCCCPDVGCCSPVVVLATPSASVVATTVAIDEPAPFTADAPTPSRAQLRLPYANGPPHATLA